MATIRDAGITGDFVHEPLPNPSTEIRLVHVDPLGEEDDDIRCTVLTHSLNNPPSYIAISYTWGDISKKRKIRIKGKQLWIGQNSWTVLWQARLHRFAEPLWIDVLSIDQTNDAEKSIQVRSMGRIYEAATSVCVSVGLHENDSSFLAEQVHAHTKYFELRRKKWGEQEDPTLGRIACGICGKETRYEVARCSQCRGRKAPCTHHGEIPLEHESTDHAFYGGPELALLRFSGCNFCGRRFAARWYEPRRETAGEESLKICRTCMRECQKATDSDSYSDLVLTDCWGEVDVLTGHIAWKDLQCFDRLLQLSREDHQRVIDAARQFSLRPYFTRLWIIQEFLLARRLIIACGNSLFPLREFYALALDAGNQYHSHPSEFANQQIQQRSKEITTRSLSWHMDTLLSSGGIRDMSLWDQVYTYCDSHCSDPRDRAFGLLALADSSSETFYPDYTKPPAEVFLTLLEHEAFRPKASDDEVNIHMSQALVILGSFRLDSYDASIQQILQLRRLIDRKESFDSNLELEDPDRDIGSLRRVSVAVHSYCRVSQDDAGELVVPLIKKESERTIPGHDFQSVQEATKDEAISIRSCDGQVLALADSRIEPGDTLVFFDKREGSGPGLAVAGMHIAGVIVRPVKGTLCIIIGQVIVDKGVRPCAAYPQSEACRCNDDSSCLCSKEGKCECGAEELHESVALSWEVHMSSEDILLFLAQDMEARDRPLDEDVAPMADLYVRPDQTARRLKTSVTSELLSSYAICERAPAERQTSE